MIPFKKIDEDDATIIAGFFQSEERDRVIKAVRRACKHGADIFMAVVDGMLVLRQETTKLYVYSLPIGNGNMRIVLMQLMEDAALVGNDWLIVGIRPEQEDDVLSALPHHFKFIGEEKYSYLDLLRLMVNITDEHCVVAMPTQNYGESVFCNNETMVPVSGQFGYF